MKSKNSKNFDGLEKSKTFQSKKISLILTTILFVVLATTIVASLEGKLVRINLISQEPDPAEPGSYMDVRFKIENIGDSAIKDVQIKLLEEYPFSLDPGGEAEELIGNLEPYQSDDSGVIVKYRVKVDENVVEGENKIKLAYKYSGQLWVEKEFTINVRTTDIVLSVDSVDSNPEVISPGKEGKVTIKLTNLADSAIRDIRVKLDLSSENIPFVPIKSTTEKKIYQIGSKASKSLTFDIMATADAETGAYKIPIGLDYYDEIGTTYSKDDIISLIVGTDIDLSVGIEKSQIYKSGNSGEVTLKFVNKGLIDIKFLNVILEDSDKYEIISPKEVYIGNIDSDDFESIEYQLYVKSTDEDIVFPLILEYMDANNNEFNEKRNVRLKLYTKDEAIKLGLEEKPAIGILIIIVIVFVGLIVYWRIKKRNKTKK